MEAALWGLQAFRRAQNHAAADVGSALRSCAERSGCCGVLTAAGLNPSHRSSRQLMSQIPSPRPGLVNLPAPRLAPARACGQVKRLGGAAESLGGREALPRAVRRRAADCTAAPSDTEQ